MKFSYTRIDDSFLPGGFAYLPLIDVNIGPNKLPIRCLIDSGSAATIIHSPLGVASGIIPADGKKSCLIGVSGGNLTGYLSNRFIESLWPFVQISLLGQIGFFQNSKKFLVQSGRFCSFAHFSIFFLELAFGHTRF